MLHIRAFTLEFPYEKHIKMRNYVHDSLNNLAN